MLFKKPPTKIMFAAIVTNGGVIVIVFVFACAVALCAIWVCVRARIIKAIHPIIPTIQGLTTNAMKPARAKANIQMMVPVTTRVRMDSLMRTPDVWN